jgi:TPR repeat protein
MKFNTLPIRVTAAMVVVFGLSPFAKSAHADTNVVESTSTQQPTVSQVDTQAQFQADLKAAQNGDVKAIFHLAQAYDLGMGVTKDPAKAVEYARQAAEKDYAPAEVELGSFYGRGIGLKQDLKEALQWYRKAAEQGYDLAQLDMGKFYLKGKGVPMDVEQAIEWFRKAAEQGNAAAQCELGMIYYFGYNDKTSYHPPNYAESFIWLKKSADQGYYGAMNNLGLSYLYGFGVAANTAEAAKWVRKAAEHGNANAQACLGGLYRDGSPAVPQDLVQAFVWLSLAARGGNPEGKHSVKEVAAFLSSDQVKQAVAMLHAYDAQHNSPAPADLQ